MAEGVRAELEFDVTRALADIDRIERQLTQATTAFSTGLTRATRQLAQIGQVRLDVRADPGEVNELRASMRATEAAADGVQREVRQVEQATERADRAGRGLRDTWSRAKTAVAAVAGAAVVGGLRSVIDAASDLAESQSKAAQVFGASVGVVEQFGDTAATSVGLARQEALEAAGTFGNLFVSMGLARDAAARMAPEIVTLGADLASFNNLEVPDALEKIRSGLVGEIEPLRSLGINFNAAQVEAKALALGLADANGELSEGAKLQARWALITEQSATAAGDFARTSDGLANQQRILKAEVANARAELGERLLPVALELARQFRSDLLPVLMELAEAAVPLFAEGMRLSVPAARGVLDLMVALAPVLRVVADAISAVPEDVLRFATTALLLRQAMGPIPGLIGSLNKNLAAGGGLTGLLRGAITPTTGLAVAAGFLVKAWVDANAKAEEHRRKVRELAEAYLEGGEAFDEAAAAQARQRFESKNQLDDLRRAGVTVGAAVDAIRSGPEALAALLDRLAERGEISFSKLGESGTRTMQMLEDGFRPEQLIDGNSGLVRSLVELRDTLADVNEVALDVAVATGEIAPQFANLGIAANTAADGTVNWKGALADARGLQDSLSAEAGRFRTAQEQAGGASRTAADHVADYLEAIQALRDGYDEAATAAKEYRDITDALAGKHVDARRAALDVEDQIKRLHEEYGRGVQEGESLAEAERRVEQQFYDVVDAARRHVEAMVTAGDVSGDTASQQQALLEKLLALKEQFPGMAGLVDTYIAHLAPLGTPIDHRIVTHVDRAELDRLLEDLTALADQGMVVIGGQGFSVIPGQQRGGARRPGQIGVVGEAGPELFMSGTAGTVVPNSQLVDALRSVVAPPSGTTQVIERERDTIQIGPIYSAEPVRTAIESYKEQQAAQFRQGRG